MALERAARFRRKLVQPEPEELGSEEIAKGAFEIITLLAVAFSGRDFEQSPHGKILRKDLSTVIFNYSIDPFENGDVRHNASVYEGDYPAKEGPHHGLYAYVGVTQKHSDQEGEILLEDGRIWLSRDTFPEYIHTLDVDNRKAYQVLKNFADEARESRPHPEGLCRHHWILDTPNNFFTKGICKNCGEERIYPNELSNEFGTIANSKRKST